jgi:mRNA-degrading endonuclease HigB of HigAB toxin-antitoxin module
MKTQKMSAIVATLLLSQAAFAVAAFAQDASYQTTTQITGGTLVDTLKQVSFISHSIKDMLAPTSELTMVHGNQKAVVSKDSTEITDLDKECIIHIDNLKKTYTVTTFAQMRQAFMNMSKEMGQMQTKLKEDQAQLKQAQAQQPSNIKTTFDVKVNNTGVTKVVNGLNAQEQVVTMTMHVTVVAPPPTPGQPPPPPVDPNTPSSMDYIITTDTWVAPDPPEIAVLQDFDKRFGEKLMQGVDAKAMAEQWKQMGQQTSAAMAQVLGSKPGASDAMAQMAKEIAKLKGTRVMEITSMGGLAPAGSPGTASAPPSGPPPTAGSIGGQIASDTANQTASGEAAKESGKMGIFGNALTNSALGAFHRKKATPAPAPAAAQAATPAAAPGTPAGMQTVVLMSTTTQKTNFSEEPIPFTAFQVPTGFKKIESPMTQMAK